MDRIHAAAAVDFQDALAGRESAVQFPPHGLALGNADPRVRERPVVGFSYGIEWRRDRGALKSAYGGRGSQASTSAKDARNPSRALAIRSRSARTSKESGVRESPPRVALEVSAAVFAPFTRRWSSTSERSNWSAY